MLTSLHQAHRLVILVWFLCGAMNVALAQSAPFAATPTGELAQTGFVGELPDSRTDGIGLFPAENANLPTDLWKGSTDAELADALGALPTPRLHRARAFLYELLLAETAPPFATTQDGVFFLARVQKLVSLGDAENAYALLQAAQPWTPLLYPIGFDLALVIGTQTLHCADLVSRNDLANLDAAKIYCAAQNTAWERAITALRIAAASKSIPERDIEFLYAFLYAEEDAAENLTLRPETPLEATILRSLGIEIDPRDHAPLFAHFSLDGSAGWRAELFAAQRLGQTDAIAANKFLGVYSHQSPAASGGIWDSVSAFQSFDAALEAGDTGGIAMTLPAAWQAMTNDGTEVLFANLYTDRLAALRLTETLEPIMWHMMLLSDASLDAVPPGPATAPNALLIEAIRRKQSPASPVRSDWERAIISGITQNVDPVPQSTQTIPISRGLQALKSLELLERAQDGAFPTLTKSLISLRQAGFDDVARDIAIELLLRQQ